MAKVQYLTVTVDRIDDAGNPFQSLIHIGPDGWSQSGDDLGDTRDLAEALFDAASERLNDDGDEVTHCTCGEEITDGSEQCIACEEV